MDYYRFFPVLYQADTLHLTLAQDGAYRRLIDHYMTSRQPLPDNDAALARIVGCALSEWAEIAPSIRPFFRPRNGTLSHKRCDAELGWQDNRKKIRSEIAQKGVEARRNKINDLPTVGQPTVDVMTTRREEKRGEERKREEINKKIHTSETPERDASNPLASGKHAASRADGLPPEVLAWNDVAATYGLAKVLVMTGKRRDALHKILKAHGSQAWSDALANVSKSRFLQGLESSWRADFDFMVHPAKFIKVIEGKYDNNDKAPAAPKPKLTPAELEAAQLERTIGLIRDGIRPVPFVPQLIRAAYASGKVTVEQMRACDCADFVSVNGHAV
jgi:uncharacterized protein YdaU (DUF1376 family)